MRPSCLTGREACGKARVIVTQLITQLGRLTAPESVGAQSRELGKRASDDRVEPGTIPERDAVKGGGLRTTLGRPARAWPGNLAYMLNSTDNFLDIYC